MRERRDGTLVLFFPGGNNRKEEVDKRNDANSLEALLGRGGEQLMVSGGLARHVGRPRQRLTLRWTIEGPDSSYLENDEKGQPGWD